MAIGTYEVHVANPAGRKRKPSSAGKRKRENAAMTDKQIKFFGTKRQRAALRTRRRNAAKKSRRLAAAASSPKAKDRARTNPTPAPRPKRKQATAKKQRRQNTGALYALVNPAKGKSMAATKKKKRQRNVAGQTTKRSGMPDRVSGAHRPRQRNPGGIMGKPQDWLALGGGAIIGGLGSTSLPQMVLGSNNTGAFGYLGMAASTAILATIGHMVLKSNQMLTAGIIAGGAGALIKRIIGDFTPLGQYLNSGASGLGLGDYLSNWSFTTPQIIGGPGNTQLGAAGTIPVSVAGTPMGAGRALMNV